MSERWDDAVKRRDGEDAAIIRREIERYVDQGSEACRPEFLGALAAFDVFDASERTEEDWRALEAALTQLQECTET